MMYIINYFTDLLNSIANHGQSDFGVWFSKFSTILRILQWIEFWKIDGQMKNYQGWLKPIVKRIYNN